MNVNAASAFYFGSRADDALTVDGGVALGLDGNDRLSSTGFGGSLYGGLGNDRYYAYGDLTAIGDSGGKDELYLREDDYEAGYLDGKHLIMADMWGTQIVIIWNFKGSGRIETVISSEGIRLSAQEIDRYVYSDGYGNLTGSELQQVLDMVGISNSDFQGVLENETALVNLNWENVFQALAKTGRTDSEAFAQAIKNEIWPMVSIDGHRAWDLTDSTEALAGSQYIGFEQSMPEMPRTLLTYELVADLALLYEAALGRKADAPGLNYFVGNLSDGQSLQDIARSFIDSTEFQQQFSNFDNRTYIDKLYLNVLKRPADDKGVQYWLTDMEQRGRTQEDVLVSFAQSDENLNNAVWLAGLNYDVSSDIWMV